MASNTTTIWDFLASKGLNPQQIAGVMGNLQVESGFDPGAYNAKENAIGIAQWEGERRTALQQFAAAHGGTEGDLNMQLGFMWQELNTTDKAVLDTIKYLPDAQSVAQEWNTQYERSADTSGDRAANADTIFQTFSTGGASSIATYHGGGSTTAVTQSASQTQLPAGSAVSTTLTSAQYQQALGTLSGVITSIPEMKKLLDAAIAKQEPIEDFINAVQNTDWYKTHSDSYKQYFALQVSNPAEYAQEVSNRVAKVTEMANQLGVDLVGNEASLLAHSSLYSNWSDAQMQSAIGAYYTKNNATDTDPNGQAAATLQQIQAYAAAYGVPVTQNQLNSWTQGVLMGAGTLDGVKQQFINSAASLYPGLKAQLAGGQTVHDIAQPYIASMANTLELPENSLTLRDPTIQKALQYQQPQSTPSTGGTTGAAKSPTSGQQPEPGVMPLWQFQNQLRTDPRWEQTNNAKQEAYSMLYGLGKSFGFAT